MLPTPAHTRQAAEKRVFVVIPSEARICFFADAQKKADLSGKVCPRNDQSEFFRGL